MDEFLRRDKKEKEEREEERILGEFLITANKRGLHRHPVKSMTIHA